MAPGPRHSRLVGLAPFLLALAASPPASAQPALRPKATAEPLAVKGPAAASAASSGGPVVAPPPTAAPAPAAPVPLRLAEVPADRLSQRCKTAAEKLLELRRARKRGKKVEPSEIDQRDQEDFAGMHLDCFDAARASLTSASAGVGEEILRSIAQVVLSRAQRSAFQLLQEKLAAAAGCKPAGPASSFPATCGALGSMPITDLVSSPVVLLNALIADFLPMAIPGAGRPWLRIPLLEEVLREAAPRWKQAGSEGLSSGFAQVLRRRIKEQVAKPECEEATSASDKALWVSGMCLIEVQAPANFDSCDADGWAAQCTDPVTTARIQQLVPLVGKLYIAKDKPALSDYTDLVCASADIGIDEQADLAEEKRKEAHDYVAALKAVFGGLGRKDWIETTSGAVRVLRLVSTSTPACAAKPEAAGCQDDRRREELFTLLAAVGNYAETFTTSAKDAATSREKILEELVERMVSRSHRDSGWVVSAGGNLSLLGGARTDFTTGAQVAFPVQLSLGLGLQSYSPGNHGFHAMVTALDLGQYVSFSGTSLGVATPSLESSVTLGLTVGAWLGLRETPYYLGAYGGISPFVKAQDKPTYQLGLVTGLYVPLLDFN